MRRVINVMERAANRRTAPSSARAGTSRYLFGAIEIPRRVNVHSRKINGATLESIMGITTLSQVTEQGPLPVAIV